MKILLQYFLNIKKLFQIKTLVILLTLINFQVVKASSTQDKKKISSSFETKLRKKFLNKKNSITYSSRITNKFRIDIGDQKIYGYGEKTGTPIIFIAQLQNFWETIIDFDNYLKVNTNFSCNSFLTRKKFILRQLINKNVFNLFFHKKRDEFLYNKVIFLYKKLSELNKLSEKNKLFIIFYSYSFEKEGDFEIYEVALSNKSHKRLIVFDCKQAKKFKEYL